MNPIDKIHQSTRDYAVVRRVLAERVARLHDEIEAVKKRLLPGIKSQAAKCHDAKAALAAQIEAQPELFAKPRTITVEGIKVGLQKQKGKVSFADAKAVVKAIRRHYPERFEDLVEVVEKPRKAALNNLTVCESRRLGLTVTEDSDAVMTKAAGDDDDKLVAKLLEEEEKEER